MKRYHWGARFYDVLSGERPVYRAGRVAGIAALGLGDGQRVLDVGCGTGLNLAPLLDRIGVTGEIVGVDRSPAMLAQARARIASHGWAQVEVVQGDVSDLAGLVGTGPGFDAAIFTYSLSIIDDWRSALDQAIGLLRPGGRIAVVDMAMPRGRWRLFWPMARIACLTGGADPYREPWERLLGATGSTSHSIIKGGHIHIAAGSRAVPPTVRT